MTGALPMMEATMLIRTATGLNDTQQTHIGHNVNDNANYDAWDKFRGHDGYGDYF